MASIRVARSCLICASRATARRQTTSFTTLLSRPFSGGANVRLLPATRGRYTRQMNRPKPDVASVPRDGETFHLTLPNDSGEPITIIWTPLRKSVAIWVETKYRWAPFMAATIRDSCTCPKCRDPVSGQKKYSSIEIDPETSITHISQVEDGLLVQFDRGLARLDESTHETVIPWETLLKSAQRPFRGDVCSPSPSAISERTGIDYWDANTLPTKLQQVDFEAFRQRGDEFWKAMSDLVRLGIVFLKNVPQDPNSIIEVTETIGNIQETFYGRTFDVQAKPNAENIAYTSEYLGLHQDLLYLSNVPRIQLLHCMENSCNGGESLFSDGGRVGSLLAGYTTGKDVLEALRTHKVPYGYHKNGRNYRQWRTVFHDEVDNSVGHVSRNLFWSPPFQDYHVILKNDIRHWLRPARILESLLNDEDAIYTRRMQPGECVIFDNCRVLHGRRAFDAAGGSRWLRGAYIEADAFNSRASQIPIEFAEHRRDSDTPLSEMFPDDYAAWREKARSMVEELRHNTLGPWRGPEQIRSQHTSLRRFKQAVEESKKLEEGPSDNSLLSGAFQDFVQETLSPGKAPNTAGDSFASKFKDVRKA